MSAYIRLKLKATSCGRKNAKFYKTKLQLTGGKRMYINDIHCIFWERRVFNKDQNLHTRNINFNSFLPYEIFERSFKETRTNLLILAQFIARSNIIRFHVFVHFLPRSSNVKETIDRRKHSVFTIRWEVSFDPLKEHHRTAVAECHNVLLPYVFTGYFYMTARVPVCVYVHVRARVCVEYTTRLLSPRTNSSPLSFHYSLSSPASFARFFHFTLLYLSSASYFLRFSANFLIT